MNEPVLLVSDLRRSYRTAAGALPVLRGIQLGIAAGELVALVGPSGSGKSTLLHAVGLLEKPDSGTIRYHGQDTSKMDDTARTAARRRWIGFVYQFHHLLPDFSAQENVALPQLLAGVPWRKAQERAATLLIQVGLSERLHHRPARLSGGEQQRVAIARALANRPGLLLADEPTGNLDPETAAAVFSLLQQCARAEGLAVLMATHNPDLARQMDRILRFDSGYLLPAGGRS